MGQLLTVIGNFLANLVFKLISYVLVKLNQGPRIRKIGDERKLAGDYTFLSLRSFI